MIAAQLIDFPQYLALLISKNNKYPNRTLKCCWYEKYIVDVGVVVHVKNFTHIVYFNYNNSDQEPVNKLLSSSLPEKSHKNRAEPFTREFI